MAETSEGLQGHTVNNIYNYSLQQIKHVISSRTIIIREQKCINYYAMFLLCKTCSQPPFINKYLVLTKATTKRLVFHLIYYTQQTNLV